MPENCMISTVQTVPVIKDYNDWRTRTCPMDFNRKQIFISGDDIEDKLASIPTWGT